MIKAMCTKATYDGGKLWEPGESRPFDSREEMHPCFKFVSEVKEEKEAKKAIEEMTKTELLKLGKDMGLKIPGDYNTKEKILNFIQASQAEKKEAATPAKGKGKAKAQPKAADQEKDPATTGAAQKPVEDKDPQGTLM